MIGDEIISGNPHLIHINNFFKKLDKHGVILFVQENRFPPSSPVHHMLARLWRGTMRLDIVFLMACL